MARVKPSTEALRTVVPENRRQTLFWVNNVVLDAEELRALARAILREVPAQRKRVRR